MILERIKQVKSNFIIILCWII